MSAAPPSAEVQAMVAKLHADYCALTKRPVPLRFFERLWWDLLSSPEYAYDAPRFGDDVAHLVRYLLLRIREQKRNEGSLLLRNFLQPERYWEDLGEARVRLKPQRPRASGPAPGESAPPPAPLPEAEELALRQKAVAEFQRFKQRHTP